MTTTAPTRPTPAPARSIDQRVAVFKALADPYRLEILTILAREVRCNCHLQDMLDLAPNHLSYHLKVLRVAGLIVGTRRGRWIDYSIALDAHDLVRSCLPNLEPAARPGIDPIPCDPEE